VHAFSRCVKLRGSARRMCAAFGTSLAYYESPRGRYRGRSRRLFVPRELADERGLIVEAVFGLDDRAQARRERTAPAAIPSGSQLLEALAPMLRKNGRAGGGERIALVELGGGFRHADVRAFFRDARLAKAPRVSAVSVDGASNRPGADEKADAEVALDIGVVGCFAPAAEIVVYFAPPTDRGYVDAVYAAILRTPQPSVISLSWGDRESNWSAQACYALDQAFAAAAALGITVCAATGDRGSNDGRRSRRAHVDYPASSPWVLACGGTQLDTRHDVEIVWNDRFGATGGGVSELYPLPPWQKRARPRVPRSVNPGRHRGRGLPDVAGLAHWYPIPLRTRDGDWSADGGTSAVAPLWAACIARANRELRSRVGLLAPLLYGDAGEAGFVDVVRGHNGAYRARRGWDACTGYGSPHPSAFVDALAAALRAAAPAAPRG